MADCPEYIIKYHHGGLLVREGESKYTNGKVDEFEVDPDKFCYWDVLADLKDLGYDIKKRVELFYMDEKGTFKPISDDSEVLLVAEYLRKHLTVDIYVEIEGVDHGNVLPEVLIQVPRNRMQNNETKQDNETINRTKREALEGKCKSKTTLSRAGRVFKCKVCKKEGHNRRSCPQIINASVTNANTQRDTATITDPANTGSSEQISNQKKAAEKGKKQRVAVPKGRLKKDAACYGPVKVLRGAHTGGLIVGRENDQFSSFITVSELMARRMEEKRLKQNQILSQQSTSTHEAPELSTQQSMTNTAARENP